MNKSQRKAAEARRMAAIRAALASPVLESDSDKLVPGDQQWREANLAFALRIVLLSRGAHWHLGVVRLVGNQMSDKALTPDQAKLVRKRASQVLKGLGVGKADAKWREGVFHVWLKCSGKERDKVDGAFEDIEL